MGIDKGNAAQTKRKPLGKTWVIPKGPVGPVDSEGEYAPIPKRSRVIPFGYDVSEEDENILLPNVDQLVALEEAAKFLRRKQYSYREVAAWLSNITGRDISHTGLVKRLKVEQTRRRKKAALKKDEARLKEIIEAQAKIDQSLGKKENGTESGTE